MSARSIAIAAAVAAAVSATALAQGARRDGQWEVKIQMEMSGMPQGVQMPVQTITQCVTKEEASDPAKTIPQGPAGRGGRGMPSNCTMADYKMEGSTATFTMKCAPPQAMTMTGQFTYGTDTYEGTMKGDIDRGGQPMTINMKYSGKRLGDCTK